MIPKHLAQLLAKVYFAIPFPYSVIIPGMLIVALLVWMAISAKNKRAK